MNSNKPLSNLFMLLGGCLTVGASLITFPASAAGYAIHFQKIKGDVPFALNYNDGYKFSFSNNGKSVIAINRFPNSKEVYQSNDYGLNWVKLNNDYHNTWQWMIYTNQSKKSLLAEVLSYFGTASLLYSDDNGKSWSPMDTTCPLIYKAPVKINQSADLLFPDKFEFYLSRDNGYSCEETSGSSSDGNPLSQSNGVLYTSITNTVYVSEDEISWRKSAQVPMSDINEIYADPENGQRAFFVNYGNNYPDSYQVSVTEDEGVTSRKAEDSGKQIIKGFIKLNKTPWLLTAEYKNNRPFKMSLSDPDSFPASLQPLDVYVGSTKTDHFFEQFTYGIFYPGPDTASGIYSGSLPRKNGFSNSENDIYKYRITKQ